MGQHAWQKCQKAMHVNAAVLSEDATWFLEQLALPIEPRDSIKARRERAIHRSGLPAAKGYRLWYRRNVRLWHDEAHRLWEAYKAHVRRNEDKATQADDEQRAQREARFMRGLQRELDFTGHQSVCEPGALLGAETD